MSAPLSDSLAFRRTAFAAVLGASLLVWLALGRPLAGLDPLDAVSSALTGPNGRFWVFFVMMWAICGAAALGSGPVKPGSSNRGIS